MKSTLHIVNRSPAHGRALEDALAAMQPDDHLILIEDAVYAVLDQAQTWPNACCHVLQEDLGARGLAGKSHGASLACVDIDGFVALTCRCDRTLSWH